MTDVKHTPGPWHYEYDNSDTGAGQWFNILGPDGDGLLHCSYNASPEVEKRCEANARLMATAPELLAQLKFAVAILEEANFRLGYAPGSLGQIEMDEAIDEGYVAIAKAEDRG